MAEAHKTFLDEKYQLRCKNLTINEKNFNVSNQKLTKSCNRKESVELITRITSKASSRKVSRALNYIISSFTLPNCHYYGEVRSGSVSAVGMQKLK